MTFCSVGDPCLLIENKKQNLWSSSYLSPNLVYIGTVPVRQIPPPRRGKTPHMHILFSLLWNLTCLWATVDFFAPKDSKAGIQVPSPCLSLGYHKAHPHLLQLCWSLNLTQRVDHKKEWQAVRIAGRRVAIAGWPRIDPRMQTAAVTWGLNTSLVAGPGGRCKVEGPVSA